MGEGSWLRPDRLKGAPEAGALTRTWPDEYTFLERAALERRCAEVVGRGLGGQLPWVVRTYDWWDELR